MTFPPHRFMNLVFAWCVERIEPDKREQWVMMLTEPLPGMEAAPPTPFQAEDEAADFMAALAMHQAQRG
jgi:hypothetical protein